MHQLVHWIQNVKSNVDYCYVWCREETRRVHFARSWTQAPKPVLTDASLPAKVGAEALHVVFSPIKHPSPARGLTDCCCCCARWVGCSSRSLAPRTRRQLAAVGLGRGVATAFAHLGCFRGLRRRSLVVRLYVARTAAATPGSTQSDFDLIKDRHHLSI